ncbi:MAG: DUF4150 domain-containing protein [Desulfovibrionaceae bacterium]
MYACTIQKGEVISPADVCQTPTPAGPVPTPYPNVGATPQGEPACEKVLISGSPALNKGSSIAQTNGDQAGVGGGVASGEIMGEAKFTSASAKVKLEGSPAVRLSDPTTQNANNCVGSCLVLSQEKVLVLE